MVSKGAISFSDFDSQEKSKMAEGAEYVSVEEILDKPIKVLGTDLLTRDKRSSTYGETYLVIRFLSGKKICYTITGSQVLIDRIHNREQIQTALKKGYEIALTIYEQKSQKGNSKYYSVK